ncbi:alkaline phosphatase D [Stackebrandtia albiflava]|uniref:Alkaline phosphatase D n=1 Tax=Stackebrandtia albiflava TaxID=406432 RepID=A0A562UQJ4_9ACTN|nr:alkaline phosphatase D family protein [Stackebrandtia albiflava]TWJ07889.1 alkaline phosphatase D [Stackebrandtia albiflava]
MSHLDRRAFLALSGAGVTAALMGESPSTTSFAVNPFQLGSASGDATTDSVILWTRLAPSPTAPDFGMAGQPDTVSVHWRIAESHEAVQSDATSLYSGNVGARKADAWSVHLEVKTAGGPLAPGKQYYYQFSLPDGSYKAWIGQTRTAPRSTADVDPNFAVISCQSAATDASVNDGPSYWHGYTHLESNPVDFVVHLGDYIYRESHENTIPKDDYCTELVDYRRRWGWYLERHNIQRVRRLYPMYAVPDDHEMYNDYQGANIKPRFGEGTDWQLRSFNHGLRTYWENMPLRGGPPTAASGEDKLRFRLDRIGLNWGGNLDLALLDCRQHRTAPGAASPTLLGATQLAAATQWINSSRATWTTLGVASPLSVYFASAGVPTSPTNWTAFPAERRRITDALAARRAAGGNPVVLAGDVHCPFAARVIRSQNAASKDFVATEFSTPSMSSYGFNWTSRRDANPDVFAWVGMRADGTSRAQPQPLKGYLRCSATSTTFYTNFLATHQTAISSGAVTSVAKFRTRTGTLGAVRY